MSIQASTSSAPYSSTTTTTPAAPSVASQAPATPSATPARWIYSIGPPKRLIEEYQRVLATGDSCRAIISLSNSLEWTNRAMPHLMESLSSHLDQAPIFLTAHEVSCLSNHCDNLTAILLESTRVTAFLNIIKNTFPELALPNRIIVRETSPHNTLIAIPMVGNAPTPATIASTAPQPSPRSFLKTPD